MIQKQKIVITGGTGIVGSHLTTLLTDRGYLVHHLSRQRDASSSIPRIWWDPGRGEIEAGKLDGFDAVIHLAGAGISDERWTEKRKKLLIDSRTESARLLLKTFGEVPHPPKIFISASGIGFYPTKTTDHIFRETDPPGDGFLSHCCRLWEEQALAFSSLPAGVTIIRTGVVLSPTGGALEKMIPPIRYYAGSPLGSGKQYVPWIHLDDICRIYVHCLENELSGIFNGVAPQHLHQRELTKAIGRRLNRPVWLPHVPGFVLKVVLGEMSNMVLKGSRVSADKIEQTGFQFNYNDIDAALADLEI